MSAAIKGNALLKRVANAPLLKLPLRIIEKQKNVIRSYNLRRKQPIIKQGSPECFEDTSPLKVEWELTPYCNNRCSYCFGVNKGYEKVFCSLAQAKKVVKHIASANRPGYQVSLHGGEPTTHPYFADIVTLLCQHLDNRLESLLIITNGSFNEEKLETILKLMEQYYLKVYVSIHLEFMSVDRAIYLVERLSKHGILIMTIMLQPDFFEKAKAIADALCELRKSYPFSFEIKYIRTPPSFDSFDPRYAQEHFDWADTIRERFHKISGEGPQLKKNYPRVSGWEYVVERESEGACEVLHCGSSDELRKMTGLDFSGMTCCAGTNFIGINPYGFAQGLSCGLARQRCNIFEENPFQHDGWMHGVTCTRPICGGPPDHRVPKFKLPAAAKKHIAKVKKAQKELLSED